MAAQRALDLELLRAAERSDVSEVARLLEAGAAINELQEDGTDADGRTVWENLQYQAIQSELAVAAGFHLLLYNASKTTKV